MDIFDEVGMERLRAKSETLTAYLEFLLEQTPQEGFSIITPRDPAQRGAQLSLQIRKGGRAVCERLARQGIICDWREPDILRVAPVPLYSSFLDVHTFAERFLTEILA
jgi:kynureninase